MRWTEPDEENDSPFPYCNARGSGVTHIIPNHFFNGRTAKRGFFYVDIVIDEERDLAYASDQLGGKIDLISLNDRKVVTSINVGERPQQIDISPDHHELAVAVTGAHEIVFIDLDTLLITDRVEPVAPPNKIYPEARVSPWDVLYGREGRLYSTGIDEQEYVCH